MTIHVTTFYSFKGGVGRTQALVNCAAWIASNQRPEPGGRPRVVMVDFDLEASGIQYVEGLHVLDPKPGIVDFIHDYLDNAGEVPDIARYISQAALPNGVQVDVILAGDQTRYHRRFGQLRFDALWQRQHGSELFLDMKNQLSELGYEFMLIDSRTGLCDTSELCTLTLPDQVVVVFAPNRQNLAGTQLVIERIRQNPLVDIIGVASRIRKTDDEHGGLRSVLAGFKGVFSTGSDLRSLVSPKAKPWLVVHEDPQQRLLSDAVAVISYPRSGLAKDYRRIARRIVARNPRSSDWVTAICADAPTRERMARRYGILDSQLDAWRKIAALSVRESSSATWALAKTHGVPPLSAVDVRNGIGSGQRPLDRSRVLDVDWALGFTSLAGTPQPEAIQWILDCLEKGQLEHLLSGATRREVSEPLRDLVNRAVDVALDDPSLASVRAEALRYLVWTRTLHLRVDIPEVRRALQNPASFREGACFGGFRGREASRYVLGCAEQVGADLMEISADIEARRWIRAAALDSGRMQCAGALLVQTEAEQRYLAHWLSWSVDLLCASDAGAFPDRAVAVGEIMRQSGMLEQLRSFWLPEVATLACVGDVDDPEGMGVVNDTLIESRGTRPKDGEIPVWCSPSGADRNLFKISDTFDDDARWGYLEMCWMALVPSAAAVLRAVGDSALAIELEQDALKRLKAARVDGLEAGIRQKKSRESSRQEPAAGTLRTDSLEARLWDSWPYTCCMYSPIHRSVIDIADLLSSLRHDRNAPTFTQLVQHSRSLPSPRVAYSQLDSLGTPMRDWGGWSGTMTSSHSSKSSTW